MTMFPSSRKRGVEVAIGNCKSLESLKGFTFSCKPEKSEVLVIGKKKEEQEVKGTVKEGEIQAVTQYKYLGEWYSEKGDHSISIQKRKEKIEYMIHEIRKYGDVGRVGKMALAVRIKIYETVVVPTVFANVETWGIIKEKEMKELEGIQYKIIRGMMEQATATPYWGLIAETGVWPVENRIEYKKVMLYHNIVNSDEKRLVKEVVEDQIRKPYKNCWGESLIVICEKYKIKIEKIKNYSKPKLKKEIKAKIMEEIARKIEDKKREMTKMRFTDGRGRRKYIEEV